MSIGPVVVALYFPAADEALALASALDPTRCRVKVGKELFVRAGPAVVHALHELGFEVFLDLKFHDIPNTVAGACRAARPFLGGRTWTGSTGVGWRGWTQTR